MTVGQLICSACGQKASAGHVDGYGVCKGRKACRARQMANSRLKLRCNGSIRYSGDTFDRVKRLERRARHA